MALYREKNTLINESPTLFDFNDRFSVGHLAPFIFNTWQYRFVIAIWKYQNRMCRFPFRLWTWSKYLQSTAALNSRSLARARLQNLQSLKQTNGLIFQRFCTIPICYWFVYSKNFNLHWSCTNFAALLPAFYHNEILWRKWVNRMYGREFWGHKINELAYCLPLRIV